jgi:glycosyltransferase involved in cell wall biosynthesis
MMETPRITIVTPCYNGERFLERTIASVRTQTLSSWEHIVVDDGSSDRSADIVARMMQADSRLNLIRQPNAGPCAARNSGLRMSSSGSAYVLFLDADDCLERDALAEMAGYLDAHPRAGMAYCARTFIDADDQPLGPSSVPTRYAPAGWGFRKMPADEARTPFASLMAYCLAVPSASLIRRSVLATVGPWDESLMPAGGAYGDDVDMALRVALVSEVHSISKLLVRYRRHAANMTNHINYAGFAVMHQKWWSGAGLTPAQRSLARRAILFDRKLTAYQQLRGAWNAAGRHDLREATRLAVHGARKSASLVLGYGAWGADTCRKRFGGALDSTEAAVAGRHEGARG